MKTVKYIALLVIATTIGSTAYIHAQTERDEKKDDSKETAGEVITLTKKDFLKKVYDYEKNKDALVYEGTLPCIVDFYADWCGPCKRVDPILKELAKEYKGKIVIYKVNTDNERDLARAFGIRSIPTYLFIPTKGEPQMDTGAKPRESFVKIINDILLKDKK
jgi:thioredoxin